MTSIKLIGNIGIFYRPNNPDFENEDKRESHNNIIINTIKQFKSETKILINKKILIYHDWRSEKLTGWGWGRIILDNICPKISDVGDCAEYEYCIQLVKEIYDDSNNIFKIFTIAHEFQHVLQCINYERLYKINSVLRGYFYLLDGNPELVNERYRNLPCEYDAMRKAKIINNEINGEDKVNDFIASKIENRNTDTANYFDFINNINVNKEYSFEKESEEMWIKYERSIEEEVSKIRKEKRNSNKLDENKSNLLEAYKRLKIN